MSRCARRVFSSEAEIVPGTVVRRGEAIGTGPPMDDIAARRPNCDDARGVTTIPHLLRTMAHVPSAPTAAQLPDSYEEALAELERLVAAMEGGQLPLDALLGSYRRGAELLNFCRSRLDAVETQVRLLEDGQLKPWGDS